MVKHHIKATNIELTDAISDYLEKKLEPLHKFSEGVDHAIARVEIGRTTNHHNKGDIFRAEINLELGRDRFRAESETSDLYSSIDIMRDAVIDEVTREKKKKQHLLKRGHQKVKQMIRSLRR